MPSTVRRDREWFRIETAARLAGSMAALSTCRRLRVGCVVVSPKLQSILAVGYNGPTAGAPNDSCSGVPGACGCVHAEANALVKLGAGSGELVVTHSPCPHCAGMVVNSGRVTGVTYVERFRDGGGIDVLSRAGVTCEPLSARLPATIVVGERRNGPTREVDATARTTACRWRALLCEGAFADPTSARKLTSIGVDLTTVRSANLLPASPTVGEWDERTARATWEAGLTDQPGATWLLCGRRVWRATMGRADGEFGSEATAGGARVVLLPHPSGLSRWWNDRANPTRLGRRLRGLLGE